MKYVPIQEVSPDRCRPLMESAQFEDVCIRSYDHTYDTLLVFYLPNVFRCRLPS